MHLKLLLMRMGIVKNLKDLNATEEMLPQIAESTVLLGAYRKLTSDDVLGVFTGSILILKNK